MDRSTIDVYEARAEEWESRRTPRHLPEARAFARRVGRRGPTGDLGCGTGFYTAALPKPVVALDAARAMLDLVPQRAPHALRIQGDLEALPFRRGALAGGWARNSYVHLPSTSVPLALAQLHHALRVGAPVRLTFFGGDREGHAVFADDDLPGRYFSLWTPPALRDVIVGAGFEIDALDEHVDGRGDVALEVRGTRARRIPDYVRPGLRLLLCGLNPSIYSADAGVGFARPGNRFWPAALEAGIATRARDPWHAVRVDRIGMTDLVKRASTGAAELTKAEYVDGLARIERLVRWMRPRAVVFLGLAGWRSAVDRDAGAGPQGRAVGGRPAYVMPNPSGLNAHTNVADLAMHLRAAAALADAQP